VAQLSSSGFAERIVPRAGTGRNHWLAPTAIKVLVLGAMVGLLPARAAAQLGGMPVWNSPRAGTGLLVAGDVGRPRPDSASVAGKGTTLAGRVALGLQAFTVSASVGRFEPDSGSSVTEYGGTAAYRLVGGSLIPVALNLQGGAAAARYAGVTTTRFTGALGLSIDVPLPGVSFEPWVAPGLRLNHVGASGANPATSNTVFGVAGGVTIGFGLIGIHAALDYEKRPGGGHTSTLGIGAHLDIRPSLGL